LPSAITRAPFRIAQLSDDRLFINSSFKSRGFSRVTETAPQIDMFSREEVAFLSGFWGGDQSPTPSPRHASHDHRPDLNFVVEKLY
jgi:hypothetical protein